MIKMRLVLAVIFLWFVILAITSVGISQTDLGVGVVSLDVPENSILRFYARPLDRSPAKTLTFFHDKSTNSRSILNLEQQKRWFSPELWGLDDNPLLFRCKSRTGSEFEVIVNNYTGRTYWIKRSASTRFKTWEKYLQGMFAIERDRNFSQKIYSASRASSNEINFKGKDCFQVRSMRGDWINIFTPTHCSDVVVKLDSGWIQWRKGNRLLIYLFPTA